MTGHDPFDRKLHVDGEDDWTLTRSEVEENRRGGKGTPKMSYTARMFMEAVRGLDQSWFAQAACRGIRTDVFYPEQGGDSSSPKSVCEGCPVREECLDYAMATGDRFGVWGGTSGKERSAMRRRQRKGAA